MKDKHNLIQEFKDFTLNNKLLIIVTSLFCILAHGIKLLGSIGIDTELQMAIPGHLSDSWFSIGRFASAISTKFFKLVYFNPFFGFFLTLICIVFASLIWCFLFYIIYYKYSNNKCIYWLFSTTFFTSTIMTDQYYFTLQSFQVTFALATCGISLILVSQWIEENKHYYMILSIPFAVWSFGTYQTFTTIYIVGSLIVFILLFQKYKNHISNIKNYKIVCIKLIIIAIINLIIYEIINKIFIALYPESSYVKEFIKWGELPKKEIIKDIYKDIIDVFTGQGLYYTKLLPLVCIILIIYLIWNARYRYKNYILYVLSFIGLIASIFLIEIFIGEILPHRAKFTIPFVVAFLLMFLVSQVPLKNNKIINLRTICCIICAIIIYSQTALSARINYTDYVRYQEDVTMCNNVSNEIYKLNLGENPPQPVIYIGYNSSQTHFPEASYSNVSIFQFGQEAEPYYYHSTSRINFFMINQGYNFNKPTEDQVLKGRYLSDDMPSYPNSGYAQQKDDIIIVKLSEDVYPR